MASGEVRVTVSDETGRPSHTLPTTPAPGKPVGAAPSLTQQIMERKVQTPWHEKGRLANASSAVVLALGLVWAWLARDSVLARVVVQVGLFALSGGITNALAVRMLFDEVLFLPGSGVIPKRFKAIRESLRDMVMKTFFEAGFLRRYLDEKIPTVLKQLKLEARINKLATSDDFDALLERKLEAIGQRPEGMFLTMMGIETKSLKVLVKPFVGSLGAEAEPMLLKMLDKEELPIEKIRAGVDRLLETKLKELTPEVVKKMMEDITREHLGWLVVWGCVFGGGVGAVASLVRFLLGDF